MSLYSFCRSTNYSGDKTAYHPAEPGGHHSTDHTGGGPDPPLSPEAAPILSKLARDMVSMPLVVFTLVALWVLQVAVMVVLLMYLV